MPPTRSLVPLAVFALVLSFVWAPIVVACTAGQRQAARTVLDVAQVACLVANATLPDAEVARVCGIVDGLDGPMRDVLKASREQIAEARARGELMGELAATVRCGDGGLK